MGLGCVESLERWCGKRRRAGLQLLPPRPAPPSAQVTAARVAAAQAGGAPKPLREQAFAGPERVAELVGRVREALGGALPAAAARMRAYLPSPATRAVLFKPIKSNVAEAHGQVGARTGRACGEQALVPDGHVRGVRGWVLGQVPGPLFAHTNTHTPLATPAAADCGPAGGRVCS